MRLALDELHQRAHTYCPVYTPDAIDEFIAGSSHITFNSVEQFHRYHDRIVAHNESHPASPVSCGLRINPMCSVIETDIYNPCCPGSRFGVVAEQLADIPEGLDGFHFHALCESTSHDLRSSWLCRRASTWTLSLAVMRKSAFPPTR